MNFIILLVTLKMFFLVSCLSSHEILATPLLLGKVQATNLFQLVELDLGKKYVVWNVVGSSKSTTRLVVGEDRLEAGSVPIKEQLLAAVVVVTSPLCRVSE